MESFREEAAGVNVGREITIIVTTLKETLAKIELEQDRLKKEADCFREVVAYYERQSEERLQGPGIIN